MNRRGRTGWVTGVGVIVVVLGAAPAFPQTFSSGSTGALGAFNPTANTTVALPADGVLNYTTVTIPAGVTVTFAKNAANTPVTMLATGDVTIHGIISVKGSDGATDSTVGPMVNPGGAGGPGGFGGGDGGARSGAAGPSGGLGPGGGGLTGDRAGTYGTPTTFVALIPLFGGSGGGGGNGDASFSGQSGGGGGGAIVIASSTKIIVNGTITARGGVQPTCFFGGDARFAGAGSGGAIRLVAPQLLGTGSVDASGGFHCFASSSAGPGRIRLEAFTTFGGTSTPVPSLSPAPGPVTAASTPALVNLPTLTFASIGGVAPPVTPTAAYATPDVALASGTTNPVTVTLAAANTPIGTVFTVKLIPQFVAPSSVNSTASTGTFANSTATANVNFPTGQVSVVTALGSFTLPQIAGLLPSFDGDPVERVLVAAEYGAPSTLTLITRSGKAIRADQLPPEAQRKLALAFAVLRDE